MIVIATLLCGCRSAPPGEEVPRYAGLTDPQILAMLAERAESIQTVSSSGVLRLEHPERGTVTLDVVLLASGEDKLRLRATKLGRGVFDLTRDGDSLWLWMAESDAEPTGSAPAVNAEQVGIGWSLLSGRLFAQPPQAIASGEALTATYLLDAESGTLARLGIDRDTVTVQSCEIVTADGVVQQTIQPGRYRLIDGHPIATQITSAGATDAAAAFTLELNQVEINGELTAAAFTPPRDAQRRP